MRYLEMHDSKLTISNSSLIAFFYDIVSDKSLSGKHQSSGKPLSRDVTASCLNVLRSIVFTEPDGILEEYDKLKPYLRTLYLS